MDWAEAHRPASGFSPPMNQYVIIGAITICFVGIVWASVMMERHRREIRIYKQIKADPYLNGIKCPRWIIQLFHSTFPHDK